MATKFRQAVLDRLNDAVILYSAGHYVASLYMSGYVIEIGIKVEFERLSDIQISDENKLMRVISLLSYEDDKSLPLSLIDLLKIIQKIKKAENARLINVCFDKNSNNHDIHEFLTVLKKWKEVNNEEDGFNIDDYDFKKHYGWTTDLRYGEESVGHPEEDAKNALGKAIKFLKEVVCLSLNEIDMNKVNIYEQRFIEINQTISSDENQISSSEQTLNTRRGLIT